MLVVFGSRCAGGSSLIPNVLLICPQPATVTASTSRAAMRRMNAPVDSDSRSAGSMPSGRDWSGSAEAASASVRDERILLVELVDLRLVPFVDDLAFDAQLRRQLAGVDRHLVLEQRDLLRLLE